jgi:hypothetical protein
MEFIENRIKSGVAIPWYKHENWKEGIYEEPEVFGLREVYFAIKSIHRSNLYQRSSILPLMKVGPGKFQAIPLPNVNSYGACSGRGTAKTFDSLEKLIEHSIHSFWTAPFGPHHLWEVGITGCTRYCNDNGISNDDIAAKKIDLKSLMFKDMMKRSCRTRKSFVGFCKRYTNQKMWPIYKEPSIAENILKGISIQKEKK